MPSLVYPEGVWWKPFDPNDTFTSVEVSTAPAPAPAAAPAAIAAAPVISAAPLVASGPANVVAPVIAADPAPANPSLDLSAAPAGAPAEWAPVYLPVPGANTPANFGSQGNDWGSWAASPAATLPSVEPLSLGQMSSFSANWYVVSSDANHAGMYDGAYDSWADSWTKRVVVASNFDWDWYLA